MLMVKPWVQRKERWLVLSKGLLSAMLMVKQWVLWKERWLALPKGLLSGLQSAMLLVPRLVVLVWLWLSSLSEFPSAQQMVSPSVTV
jgi:hypothetical protein